jgi:hypothetical protein
MSKAGAMVVAGAAVTLTVVSKKDWGRFTMEWI